MLETFLNTLIILCTGTAFIFALFPLFLLIKFLVKKLSYGSVKIEIDSKSIKISRNEKLVTSARIAYVEMSGRKIVKEFEEEHDAISEIYNSYYSAFKILRELKKNLSQSGTEGNLYFYIDSFLEDVLRPHLTKYQSKYRAWLKKEQKDNNFMDENTSQKKYVRYNNIINEIKEINIKAQKTIILIGRIAYKGEKYD